MIEEKYYVGGTLIIVVILFSGLISIYTGNTPANTNTNETVEIVETGEQYTVTIADNESERYTGLSNYESLEDGHGMLFVFNNKESHTFVMRDMDFGIDIIFINKKCEITNIYNADKPASDESGTEEKHQYVGEAMYVLEVPYKSTNASVGDRVSMSFCS